MKKITVRRMAEECGFSVLAGADALDREADRVFCCDLLSFVMGRAPADSAWVTVMGNVNAVAVAVLAEDVYKRQGQTGKKTGTAESSTEEQDGEAEAESGNSAAEDEQGEEEEPAEEIESEPEAAEAFSSYSPEDYRVLLRIVQAEAGGCDIKGKILVANVILNRVASEEFPDTITEVVYEKRQFSPVSDGSINRCQVAEETVEAVDRASVSYTHLDVYKRQPQTSGTGTGMDSYFWESTLPNRSPKSIRPLSRVSRTYSALPLEIW